MSQSPDTKPLTAARTVSLGPLTPIDVTGETLALGPEPRDARTPARSSGISKPDLDELDLEHQRRRLLKNMFGIEARAIRLRDYVLIEELGRGGMGVVYEAYDRKLDRKIAIKLLGAAHRGPRAQARFLREARALARLSHPNIVQIHEVDTHADSVYIAMEFIPGRTLGEWASSAEPTRPWSELVAMLIQAGRGLEAAHSAGLVHRDFKPDNVIVGDDGRARVLDFGLVRGADSMDDEAELDDSEMAETEEDWPTQGGQPRTAGTHDAWSPNPLGAELTVKGAVMGTPIYMAPEQHLGGVCGPLADQYAFCVTAFELLHGVRPFDGTSMAALSKAKRRGAVAKPTGKRVVPPAVRAAILRGLSLKTDERWPDMSALLSELERALSGRRPWRWVALAGGSLALALGLGLSGSLAEPLAPEPCAIESSLLKGTWDDERRADLRAAFAATGSALAGPTLEVVERNLDRWSEAWLAAQVDSCEATHVRGTQSETMLDRRAACLERRRAEAGALVDVFAGVETETLPDVGKVLAALPDLGRCTVPALEAGVGEAEGPTSPEVDQGYVLLTRARAKLLMGKVEEARELADTAERDAEQLEHRGLRLEARAVRVKVELLAGNRRDGIDQLRAVAKEAEGAELFDLAASLRVELARAAAGEISEPDVEQWLIDDAELALARVGRVDDPREVILQVARAKRAREAEKPADALAAYEHAYAIAEGRVSDEERELLHSGIGIALWHGGEPERARAELERSLTAIEQLWGASSPNAATLRYDLGVLAIERGELEEASAHFDVAQSVHELAYGPESLAVARDRSGLASVALMRSDYRQARAHIDAALPVFERELGPEHDETAELVNSLGAVCAYMGDLDGALFAYRRSLQDAERTLGEEHVQAGVIRYNIGDAHWRLGQLDEAQRSFERSRVILEAGLGPEHAYVAYPLKGLGLVGLDTGDAPGALELLEHADGLAGELDPYEDATLHFGLARALLLVHGQAARTRADELSRQARDELTASELAWLRQTISDWRHEQGFVNTR